MQWLPKLRPKKSDPKLVGLKHIIGKILCFHVGDWWFNRSRPRRYPTIWRNFILQYKIVNLWIEVDRTDNVLWCVNDIVLPKSIRSVVIQCGTNNINTSRSDEISLGVLDPFPIVTQILRSLLLAYYQEIFIGLR